MFNNLMKLVLGITLMLISSSAHSEKDLIIDKSISGPFTHENLNIFFIHDTTSSFEGEILTLSEALESGKIEVFETGVVSELQIMNLCDQPIFIQAGDIVKGGRQDRVFQYDLVVKPESGRIIIKSFCVEQNRWAARGKESVTNFESSNYILNSKELKLAAKSKASQTEVWLKVAEVQHDLSQALDVTINAEESPSSLQLTLENEKLQEQVKSSVNKLTENLNELDNVIGFVFAINNEINSADIYGSSMLFTKMWPKLIEAAVMEAVSNNNQEMDKSEVTKDEIISWLESSEIGVKTTETLNDNVILLVIESDENMVFETKFEKNTDHFIHKNVIKK